MRNRVDLVTATLPFEQWRYVPTSENPADLLTHGMWVHSLMNSSLWLRGPLWLSTGKIVQSVIETPVKIPESHKIKACIPTVCENVFDESLISHHSNFDKLTQIVSLVYKYMPRLRPFVNQFDD